MFSQPELVNKFGDKWIGFYTKSYSSQAETMLNQLEKGETDEVVKLLQDPMWTDVLLDDRPYWLKREVLKALCMVFHANKDYKQLLHWVTMWRALDERDVDAMAFWYEALRHTTDRQKFGVNGLSEGQRKFPENILFQKLYIQSRGN